MDLGQLSGLGQKRKEKLKGMGIDCVEDLLLHMPRRYEWIESDLTAFKDHPERIFHIEVFIKSVQQKSNFLRFEGFADQERVSIVFFHQNYRKQTILPNRSYSFLGKLTEWRGHLQMVNPALAKRPAGKRSYEPVYPLTKGITQTMLRGWIRQGLNKSHIKADNNPLVPKGMMSMAQALEGMHFPESPKVFENARRRLAAEEIVKYQLAQRLTGGRDRQGIAHHCGDLSSYLNLLPFQLTKGQEVSLQEIRKDMSSDKAMYRLLQGDVGSGKTVVAFLAMATAMESGNQTAYLAPTEVLAKQVHEKAQAFFEAAGIPCLLLTGSINKSLRPGLLAQMAEDKPLAVIGTHALFLEDLVFSRLSLIVTDEQHRFGVAQRAALHGKGKTADLLAMSATPIPRTLAMTLYGEMDISTIQTRPAGRKPIKTYMIGPGRRESAYEFLARQVEKDQRGFVICPLIDEGEEENGPKSIEALDAELNQTLLLGIPHGILHGRMKKKDQDEAFARFVKGAAPVLLSTTVVEVGVDVAKATVILIESAERFGLAQLHQLRGRVGRSDRQSYCILVCYSRSQKSIDRMRVMVESQDGFEIAEKDLALRGQGNLFGLEQHGNFGFRFFDVGQDQRLWEQVAKSLEDLDGQTLRQYAYLAQDHLDNMKEVRNAGCE